MSAPGSAAPHEEGLQRKLKARHLTMIAIGGAIGVGLFLGSAVTIRQAGPGVILSYLLSAPIALVVAYALAEMAVVHPLAGSFGIYAERYLNPWAGLSVRLTYSVVQVIAIGAEVTAVAIYFGYWFPDVPPWLWVAATSLGLVAINAAQVGSFGEFEYWFALVKVVAILAFIGVGGLILLGLVGPGPAPGLSNLTAHGGFLPNGWRGVWLAVALALTSYIGVEVVAVTAGEAERPEESIPKAMRTIVFRLIAFYVLAVTVMLAMTPWNQGGGALDSSPFVRAFSAAGIPFAAGLMNFVVITAALSSANTNLYLSTRMLFSLGRAGYLPERIARLGGSGVPTRALALSTLGMAAAILLAVYAPADAFLLLYGTAVAGMLFVWVVILLSHLRFRAAEPAARIAALPLSLRGHPLPTLLAIAALLAVAATTLFIEGLRYSFACFLPFLGLISLQYALLGRRAAAAAGGAAP